MFSIAVLACLLGLSSAIDITAPAANSSVAAGSTTTLTWSTVDTDPDVFSIYLVNFVDWPPSYVGIAYNVQTSSGSKDVQIPCNTNPSFGYQLNAINGTNTYVIYAQSGQFSVSPSSPGCTDSGLPTPPGCGVGAATATTVTVTATPSTCFAANTSVPVGGGDTSVPTSTTDTAIQPSLTDSSSSILTNPLQSSNGSPTDSSTLTPTDSSGNSPSSFPSPDSSTPADSSAPTFAPAPPDTSNSTVPSSPPDLPISQGAPVSYGTVPGTIGWVPTGYSNPVTINPPIPTNLPISSNPADAGGAGSPSFNPGGVDSSSTITTPPASQGTGAPGSSGPSPTQVSPPISNFTGAAAPRRTGAAGWMEVAALGGLVAMAL